MNWTRIGQAEFFYAIFMCLIEGATFKFGYNNRPRSKWVFINRCTSLSNAKEYTISLTKAALPYYEISDIAQIKIVKELLQYRGRNEHLRILEEETVFTLDVNKSHNWMTVGF